MSDATSPPPSDPRWHRLTFGLLSPEETEALRAEAMQTEQGRRLWETCRPLSEEDKGRILRRVDATLAARAPHSMILPLFRPSRLTLRIRMRVQVSCTHCDFHGLAWAEAEGSAAAHPALVFFPAPQPGPREREAAMERARAKAREFVALASCPRCGRAGETAVRYVRRTRIAQALLATAVVGVVALVPTLPLAVAVAILGVAIVALVGVIRGLRVMAARRRVTFLATEAALAATKASDLASPADM